MCGAPSTILHLDNTIAELRRSPASVEHHHRHHAVVLTKLSLNTRLDRSSRDVIELNRCRTSEVPCVRYLIGRIVKTYDYINRVVITLPLSVYEGTWTHSPPLIAMHLLDRSCVIVGIFLKLHATFPTHNSPNTCTNKQTTCNQRDKGVVNPFKVTCKSEI